MTGGSTVAVRVIIFDGGDERRKKSKERRGRVRRWGGCEEKIFIPDQDLLY